MDANTPIRRRPFWDPVRIWGWFSSPVATQLEAVKVLRVVWIYFSVTIGVVMIGDGMIFLWGHSKGSVREFPLLSLLGEAATLSIVYLMTARRSRSLAIVLFLSVLSIAAQSLHALNNVSSPLPLITVVISMVNAVVLYKAVTATFQYHSILNTKIVWRHVLLLAAVVFIGGLSMSLLNEMIWNSLRVPLNLSSYSTEIEGRLNLCWLALTCFLCSKLLASRFPMARPIVIQPERK